MARLREARAGVRRPAGGTPRATPAGANVYDSGSRDFKNPFFYRTIRLVGSIAHQYILARAGGCTNNLTCKS
jgi:hypothetical protein